MKLKQKDFIEIDYTGTIKDDNIIFDTTDEKIAKENNIFNEKMAYGPAIVCLGEGHLLKGLDDKIIGSEKKDFDIDLTPDEGFGKKSAKLLRLIPAKVFRKEKIMAVPGLEVNIDGMTGIVRTVSGGRVIVDFNHPLSGKNLNYKINIKRKIEDAKEKIKAVFKLELRFDIDCEVKDDSATITADLPKEVHEELKKRVKELVPEIKEITFKAPEKKE